MTSLPRTNNRLLQKLSPDDRKLLQSHLKPAELKVRLHLEIPNKPIEHVIFPESGIASVVAEQPNGSKVEVGIIGREGMTGLAVALGSQRSANSTFMQIGGDGQRISAERLRAAMRKSPSLHGLFLKYVQAFMAQTVDTAVANARATIPERLARWLLMAQDRLADDRINLTHEFLSQMLAVRRAGVTETINSLQAKSLIQTSRGEIIVLKRKGLEQLAGKFYGPAEAEYARVMS